MTERPHDKSKDCGRSISDLERFTWNGLLIAFQIQDTFIHQGGPRFLWNNDQYGLARRLARLDRLYTPTYSRIGIHQKAYFIHGYPVGLDHSPVQLEISIGNHEVRRTNFKWNVLHLQGKIIDMIQERWNRCPAYATFFYKLWHITKFFRQMSKQKAKDFKREELNTRANLELVTATLHEDMYNIDQQGEVNRLCSSLEEIETRKTKGVTIRSSIKWQQMGDKCTAEFFKSVHQKNSQAIISELKNMQGQSFTRQEDLGKICLDFYKDLYKFKEVSNLVISEVFEGFTTTFTKAMNECFSRDIIVEELDKAIASMAKGKAPGHDGIPMEFFKKA